MVIKLFGGKLPELIFEQDASVVFVNSSIVCAGKHCHDVVFPLNAVLDRLTCSDDQIYVIIFAKFVDSFRAESVPIALEVVIVVFFVDD